VISTANKTEDTKAFKWHIAVIHIPLDLPSNNKVKY